MDKNPVDPDKAAAAAKRATKAANESAKALSLSL
jgi:hypothetical protein